MQRGGLRRGAQQGGTAVSDVVIARARYSRRPLKIGVLLPVPGNDAFLGLLRDGLQDLGATEEGDFSLEVRRADGTIESFRRLGTELAALPLDVFVTASTMAASTLGKVTTTTPIVFVGVFDPVAAGLVASLERPGRNLTGIAGFQADIAAEWVSHLKELAPGVTRLVIFSNPASVPPAALAGWRTVASRIAEIDEVHVDTVEDIDRSIAGIARDRDAGVIVVPHTFPFANRAMVVAAMAKHRVPAVYGIAEMVRAGGLISYGQDLGAQWRMSAAYIDKIARGARPGELPVQYAAHSALAINQSAAAALGLVIPKALIERAREVIK